MKNSTFFRAAIAAAFFFASAAFSQTPGTVTNHAFVIGKGAGQTGYTSLLCGSAQLAVGQSAADPICRTITGDVTITAAGATAIGATKVTSAMLNADVFSTAHTWAGQQTFVAPILGTPASGTLTNATGFPVANLAGAGTGVLTALGVNVGSAGAFVVNGGALGTPSSGVLTNATGLPVGGIAAIGAYAFIGNNTGSSAVPSAVTISGLTSKASPAANDLVIIEDSAASFAWKKATVSSVSAAGSVASIDGATGAFTISAPLTRSSQNLTVSAATASATGVVKRQRMAIVREEQVSGTNGGTFTSGSDQTRVLNTEVSDLDGIVSVASNQFTLGAGTWLIQWSAPAYKVDAHQTILRNVTDSSDVTRGTVEFAFNTTEVVTRSIGRAIVTIAGSKAFEIRHRAGATRATSGFGTPGSLGTEVYTEVLIMSYDQ